jgi:hypothetical protein
LIEFKILDELKKRWIEDYGSLGKYQAWDGYTMAGFVEYVLNEMIKEYEKERK